MSKPIGAPTTLVFELRQAERLLMNVVGKMRGLTLTSDSSHLLKRGGPRFRQIDPDTKFAVWRDGGRVLWFNCMHSDRHPPFLLPVMVVNHCSPDTLATPPMHVSFGERFDAARAPVTSNLPYVCIVLYPTPYYSTVSTRLHV
jgi:hypothetical protein